MSYGIDGGETGQRGDSAQHARTSVLLAEDEPRVCQLVCAILSQEYEVEVASDQQGALEQLHVRRPDIVLIDLDAQKLDAAEVLREIRRDPGLRDTPVIILAGSAHELVLDREIRQRADDFIAQPIDEVELLARVSARLEIARLRREADQARMHATRILESITDGFFTVNSDWVFTFLNPQAERMLSRRRDEMVGKNVWDVFPYLIGTELYNALLQAMSDQTSMRMRFKGPQTGIWLEIYAYPCAMHGLAIYLRDVTAEQQAQEALRESEEKYRVLVEVSPQVIWSSRPDGYVTYANQRWFEVTGLTMEQTKGSGWTAAVHPEHLDRVLRVWRESLQTGTLTDAEFPIRIAADGSYRWYHFRGIPIFDKAGHLSRWMGVAVDVHDRRSAAREREDVLNALQENDQKKDEFLAMLAHELRNPLAAVGNAVAVLEMSEDPVDRHWACEVVQRQLIQLTRMVDDLLDVSRIRSGKISLHKERLDAAVILDRAVASVTPLISNRRHELITCYNHNGSLSVEADPARLEQILVNLLTNAAKYTEPGGRIWLTAQRDGDSVLMNVRDTGMGIPPEKLPEMFELFAQGERTITRSDGGLGLGLTIVRKLAEMHGGTVTAHSDGLGKGSEFCVRLPAAGQLERSAPEGSNGTVRTRGMRILVVDDSIDTVQGLSRILKFQGHTVEPAYNGTSALEVAQRFKPDVVLLDIGLPGVDGYSVAAQLRADAVCKSALIIAVSGYGQEEDRRRSKEAGFDHHLVKPVDLEELKALLNGGPSPRPDA